MADNSKIEWTHHTDNLWHGCTKVHEGCDHCYAETLSRRWGHDIWGNDKPRKEIKSVWKDFARQQIIAAEAGELHRVFVGSMMDIFEKPMPVINSKGEYMDYLTDYLRQKYFQEIVPATPNLMHLMLTKRPSNINKYIPAEWKINPPANVMFGTSPVNQETMEKLGGQLMEVEGNRFLSIEPMLGPISLPIDCADGSTFFDWIICGGESGHGARPIHPYWVRSLRDQCDDANVPFLFKQWGEWAPPGPDSNYDTSKGRAGGAFIVAMNGTVHCFKDTAGIYAHVMLHYGKKNAGRLLDGKIYDEVPEDLFDEALNPVK